MLGPIVAVDKGRQVRRMEHAAPGGELVETPLEVLDFHMPAYTCEGKKRAIFVDRDGVLNRFGDMKSPADVDELMVPGAVDSLVSLMKTTGLPVYVVSNQQGCSTEAFAKRARAEMAMDRLAELVVAQGGKFAGVLFCPNKSRQPVPEGTVNAFKPHGGMFLEVSLRDGIDLSQSYMIGDSVKDMISARAAHPGMTTVLVKTGNKGQDEPRPYEPTGFVANIVEASRWVIAREGLATPGLP